MGNIRPARPSPRIEKGIILWYEGDEFEIVLELDLTDADGEEIILGDTETVTVEIKDRNGARVKQFVFSGNNYITLKFDEETTELFRRGSYFYDIIVDGACKTTVANDNRIIVE